MKDFIDIKPDFTLDKDIDNSAPTGKENVFTDMKNYIPEQGSILTRGGISSFDFVDETFLPYQDPELLMWLRCETTPTVDDCEIQGVNFMNNNGVSADAGTKWEGSGSAYMDTYTASTNMTKEVTGLPNGFPAKDSDEGYLITFYYKLDWYPELTKPVHVIWKSGEPGGSDIFGQFYFTIKRDVTDSKPVAMFTPYDRNGASTGYEGSLSMTNIYHIGLWVSFSLQKAGMRIHDMVSGGTVNYTWVCNGTSYDNSAGKLLTIGYSKFKGWIDDIMFFKSAPSTEGLIYAKIDSIRRRNE